MTAVRQEALGEIVEIARRHDLTAQDIAAALEAAPEGAAASPTSPAPAGTSMLTQVLGYLGGIFIFSGLVVFIGMQWSAMNSLARIIITLGSGLAAYGMALVAHRDERFMRAATPLFLISAVLQAVGILVACDEFSSGGDERHAVILTAAALAIQQGLTFRSTRRTALLFTTLAFGLILFGTTMDLLDIDEDFIWTVLGASSLSLSLSIDRTSHRVITPFWYGTGATALLVGLFQLVENTALELLFLLPACGLIYFSTWVRSRTLLVVSTVAILSYIGYFTAEHFVDAIGWPIALIFLGLTMIGLSAFAVRINRQYIR